MRSTKAALDLALGRPLTHDDITPKHRRIAMERAILPVRGIIESIGGIEEARAVDGIFDVFLTKRAGERMFPLTSNIGKVGHIIAHGETYGEAEAAYEKARACIRINTISPMTNTV